MTKFRTAAGLTSVIAGIVLLAGVAVAAAPSTPSALGAQAPAPAGPSAIPNPSLRMPLPSPPPPKFDEVALPDADRPDDPNAVPWSEPIGDIAGDPSQVQPVVVNCGPMMVCCFDFENPDSCQQFVDALAQRWACTGGAGSAVCIHPDSPVN